FQGRALGSLEVALGVGIDVVDNGPRLRLRPRARLTARVKVEDVHAGFEPFVEREDRRLLGRRGIWLLLTEVAQAAAPGQLQLGELLVVFLWRLRRTFLEKAVDTRLVANRIELEVERRAGQERAFGAGVGQVLLQGQRKYDERRSAHAA